MAPQKPVRIASCPKCEAPLYHTNDQIKCDSCDFTIPMPQVVKWQGLGSDTFSKEFEMIAYVDWKVPPEWQDQAQQVRGTRVTAT